MGHNASKNKKRIPALAGILALFLLSSCDGVIFDEVRKEVKLSDAEISGDIQSIVRYAYDGSECVFTSNGEIYFRKIDTDKDANGESVDSFADSLANVKRSFTGFSTPNGYVYSLAADEKNLYALSVVIEKDDDGYNVPTTRSLYCFDGSAWTAIWSMSYSGSTSAILFCTNAPQSGHRRAYFRYGTSIYKLDGSEIDTSSPSCLYAADKDHSIAIGENFVTDESTISANTTTEKYPLSVNSCAYFEDNVYFSTSDAMTTNETFDEEATAVYYASGDNVYYKRKYEETTKTTDEEGNETETPTGNMLTSDWTAVDLNCDTIYSLGVASDYLLAGTDEGIVHSPLTENKPAAGTADFSTNADSTLSSYYKVFALLVIDPAQTETGGTIFASSTTSSTSASFNNIGLWSYFASENEWNRE